MLRKVKELKGFKLGARDGDIGRIKNFYLENHRDPYGKYPAERKGVR